MFHVRGQRYLCIGVFYVYYPGDYNLMLKIPHSLVLEASVSQIGFPLAICSGPSTILKKYQKVLQLKLRILFFPQCKQKLYWMVIKLNYWLACKERCFKILLSTNLRIKLEHFHLVVYYMSHFFIIFIMSKSLKISKCKVISHMKDFVFSKTFTLKESSVLMWLL